MYYDQGPMFDHPDGIVLVECWETAAQHAAHTAAPHFKAFGSVLRAVRVEGHLEEIDPEKINPIALDLSVKG